MSILTFWSYYPHSSRESRSRRVDCAFKQPRHNSNLLNPHHAPRTRTCLCQMRAPKFAPPSFNLVPLLWSGSTTWKHRRLFTEWGVQSEGNLRRQLLNRHLREARATHLTLFIPLNITQDYEWGSLGFEGIWGSLVNRLRQQVTWRQRIGPVNYLFREELDPVNYLPASTPKASPCHYSISPAIRTT